MLLDRNDNPKLRKTDIEVILKPIDDKKPLNASSVVDPGIFTGKNKLRVVQEVKNRLWRFKYQFGELPVALQQKFTTADDAIEYARNYFDKRNIKIVDVID